MASAEHLKALLKSHLEGDDDRFFSVAMQVAAHEARRGHGKLAEELRVIIDEGKSRYTARPGSPRGAGAPVPIGRPRGELADLLEAFYPKTRVAEMILSEVLANQIQRVIREQRHAGRIVEHGLSPRRKLLLTGPPGTGKTLTASALSGELGLPLFQVRLDGLITKFMGETAAKLRQIFDATSRTRGVYFFDEFDAIGSKREIAHDVGEIRRVLNSFLQMIEAGSIPQSCRRSNEPPGNSRFGALPSFRRHPALRTSGKTACRQAAEDASFGLGGKRSTVAELGRSGGGIELCGNHPRIRRGTQGRVDP